MHRFFVPSIDLLEGASGDTVSLPSLVARQVASVLKLRQGERITVFAGDRHEWTAEVILSHTRSGRSANSSRVDVVLLERSMPDAELHVEVTVAMALTRADRYETALAKCTELGASSFVPLISERVQKRDAHVSEHRLARWRRIVAEAAELAGRVTVPDIANPVSLSDAMNQIRNSETRSLFLWERATSPMLLPALSEIRERGDGRERYSIALIIGPVGGFSDREAEQALDYGATVASLGKLVLRTDTAAALSMGLVAQVWG